MAGGRIELLLLGLTGTLLLFSVWGWEQLDNPTDLLKFYEEEQWGYSQSVSSPGKLPPKTQQSHDDGSDAEDDAVPDDGSDAEDDAVPDDDGSDAEDDAETHKVEDDGTTDDVEPSADYDFKNSAVDWASGTEGGVTLDSQRNPASSTNWNATGPTVVCTDAGFQVTGPLKDIKVVGSEESLSAMNAPEFCDFAVNSLKTTLTVPFTGCNVKHTLNHYMLKLSYVDESGKKRVATTSCEQSPEVDLNISLCTNGTNEPGCMPDTPTSPRSSQPRSSQTRSSQPRSSPLQAQNCVVPPGEQVTCGYKGISPSNCRAMGCCVCHYTASCYYPLDECTADKHFVFAIRYNSVSIRVDPKKLVVPGFPNCKPVLVNTKVAIFKFKVTDCGTRVYQVGETRIYLAEVQTVVSALNLKYGIITRNEPLRFIVECRYSKTGAAPQSLASTGYMVKTPSSNLPSSLFSNGYYGVQLKIAKDEMYSSYYPHHYQPLRVLLGKPVYLELRSTQKDTVILVNYCVAYPRSAKNALVLIYEGCANTYDPNVQILKVADLPNNRYQRRFRVDSFIFMEQKTNRYLDEEICFMCSTEVCRPSEKQCKQQCFDGRCGDGYHFRSRATISHLLDMDDIKLYARNEQDMNSLIHITRIYSNNS
ncbi:zona pellucida sperm-binding protein 4-like [Pempheris klunzingeri]|uniref:zona pellucida sperm-binding protein 4-like n=1 Tax=Pempheris klunzingeri TaxID=3127111 RepID=UPI0039806C5F